MEIIQKNQYDFIKSRTIQDYFAWAIEYLHLCPHSKNKILHVLEFCKVICTPYCKFYYIFHMHARKSSTNRVGSLRLTLTKGTLAQLVRGAEVWLQPVDQGLNLHGNKFLKLVPSYPHGMNFRNRFLLNENLSGGLTHQPIFS